MIRNPNIVIDAAIEKAIADALDTPCQALRFTLPSSRARLALGRERMDRLRAIMDNDGAREHVGKIEPREMEL